MPPGEPAPDVVDPAPRGDASGSIDLARSSTSLVAAESGSIDVAVSDPELRAAAESGSIDIAVSAPELHAAAESGSIDVAVSSPRLASDGTPVEVTAADSAPVASGAVRSVVAAQEGTERSSRHRITEGMKDALGGSVSALGSGLGSIGVGVSRLGEKSRKVPLVGSSVSALGESISSVGESLTELPRVAGTRRGRLLVRSMVVGFAIVTTWIVVIVGLQVRGTDAPDFRPNAEAILIELSSGPAAIDKVFEGASPRFQEFVSKDQFVANMTDLHRTVGNFKEIAAVNETLVTRGPTGRVGRVSLTVSYDKGKTKASVSLHQHEGTWKLLGIGVEVPPEIEISQAQREERVQACKDPMDPKRCDVFVVANQILEQLRDGQADVVWDAADEIFHQQEEKQRWVKLQQEHAASLGDYRRIILVTEAKVFGGTNVTFDVLLEYARSSGVRAIFGFSRSTLSDPWRLRSLKRVLPMPRADEPEPITPITPVAPEIEGTGSAAAPGTGSARR